MATCLMRPSAGHDVKIEQPTDDQRELLTALDGGHTVEQLSSSTALTW